MDQDVPSVVVEGTKTVARQLNADLAAVARAVTEEITDSIPELAIDQRLLELLGASVEGNVENIVHMLAHDIPAESMAAPSAAKEYARRLAQQGGPIHALVRAYRLGQHRLLKESFTHIHRMFDDYEASLIYQRFVAQTFAYIDWISEEIISVYQDEREGWLTDQQVLRSDLLRKVIAGHAIDFDAAGKTLGYTFHQWHLAAVIWTAENDDAELSRIERDVVRLAHHLGCSARPLVFAQDRSSAWAWFPFGPREPDQIPFASAVEELDVPLRFALGSASGDVPGFQLTLHQAQRAHDVAYLAGHSAPAVLAYSEVSSVSQLTTDLPSTKEWVETTLGSLAIDDENHERLRETLRIFLALGSSYTAAATELTMHKNSVKYRVERASQERGRPIAHDRMDVELALAACHWLGHMVLRPPDATP
jgi:DNA-binding PucR family transcriptional regulator